MLKAIYTRTNMAWKDQEPNWEHCVALIVNQTRHMIHLNDAEILLGSLSSAIDACKECKKQDKEYEEKARAKQQHLINGSTVPAQEPSPKLPEQINNGVR